MRSLIARYSFHLISLAAIFILWNMWKTAKYEAIRWETNYSALKNDTGAIVEAETLTKKELEKEYEKLATRFEGKTKQIVHVHDIVYRDTGINVFKIKYKHIRDTFYPTGQYLYSDSCLNATISLKSDSLSFSYNYENNITVYGFWERSKKFPRGWEHPLISWGRKKLKAEVKSNCGNILYNKYIEIKK